jgi:hypothetical protein
MSRTPPEYLQFFATYKPRLLERFEQIEIYIACFPIEIL